MINSDAGVFGARLCTATSSMFLVFFYSLQMYWGRCNFHPLYVQCVTALVYTLSTFGKTGFLTVSSCGEQEKSVAVGRYLFWIMTCPVIIANVVLLTSRLNPKGTPLQLTVTLMCKDIMMCSFGIIGAFQSQGMVEYIFVIIAFGLYIWLGYDIYHLTRENKKHFPPEIWLWITRIEVFIGITWSIFPLLYVLGEPLLFVITPEADAIAHAIADLLAKNVGGFIVWYVRFFLIEPEFAKRLAKTEAAALLGGSPLSIVEESKAKNIRRRGPNGRSVLIVETRIELQRLLAFLLESMDVTPSFAFTLDQAKATIMRERCGYFDAVFLSLKDHHDDFQEIESFRISVSQDPYYLPVLGYNFDDYTADNMEHFDDEWASALCDAYIHHILDEQKVSELVSFWKRASLKWRDAHKTIEAQKELIFMSRTHEDETGQMLSTHSPQSAHSPLTRRASLHSMRLGHSDSHSVSGHSHGHNTQRGSTRQQPSTSFSFNKMAPGQPHGPADWSEDEDEDPFLLYSTEAQQSSRPSNSSNAPMRFDHEQQSQERLGDSEPQWSQAPSAVRPTPSPRNSGLGLQRSSSNLRI